MNYCKDLLRDLHTLVVMAVFSTAVMASGDLDRSVVEASLMAISKDGVASAKIVLSKTPLCESAESNRVLVSSIRIQVGNNLIFVPRSAYADLFGPTYASIEFRGNAGVVSIRGGDGAEAYVVRLFFDRRRVNRRTLASALLESKPTEETRYLLRVMKDE